MSTITALIGTDGITTANSMTKINTNFSNLNTDKIETSYLDTDTALTANSDTKIATQKAIKTYVNTIAATTYLVPTGAILPYGGSSAPSNFLLCDGTAVSRSTYATLFAITSTSYGVGDGSTTFNLPDLRSRFPLGAGTGTKIFTFASRSSNTITVTGSSNSAFNEIQTGQALFYATTGTVMTGLSDDTTYYAIRVAYNQFTLATSVANAVAGTVITLTGSGTGTQTFTKTFTANTRGDTGGEETHALTIAELAAHTHTYGEDNGAGSAKTLGTFASSGANASSSTGGSTAHNTLPPFVSMNYIIKT